MKKLLFITVAVSLIAAPTIIEANDVTKRLGLGFSDWRTPVGARYMFSEKAGFQVGFGLDSYEFDPGGGVETRTDWALSAGIPVNIHQVGDRVNFNFLPTVRYQNFDNGETMDASTEISVLVALEFEAFVTMDFSVSAAHGFRLNSFDPGDPAAESTTSYSLFGENLTSFGFHYYLPGGE